MCPYVASLCLYNISIYIVTVYTVWGLWGLWAGAGEEGAAVQQYSGPPLVTGHRIHWQWYGGGCLQVLDGLREVALPCEVRLRDREAQADIQP